MYLAENPLWGCNAAVAPGPYEAPPSRGSFLWSLQCHPLSSFRQQSFFFFPIVRYFPSITSFFFLPVVSIFSSLLSFFFSISLFFFCSFLFYSPGNKSNPEYRSQEELRTTRVSSSYTCVKSLKCEIFVCFFSQEPPKKCTTMIIDVCRFFCTNNIKPI